MLHKYLKDVKPPLHFMHAGLIVNDQKCGQATKGVRWMPRRQKLMKDVEGCDKPRVAAKQASTRGFPNGETHHP